MNNYVHTFTANKHSNARKSLRRESEKNDVEKRHNSSRNHFPEEPPQKRNKKDDAGRKRQNSSRSQSSEGSLRKRQKIQGKKDTQRKSQIRKRK